MQTHNAMGVVSLQDRTGAHADTQCHGGSLVTRQDDTMGVGAQTHDVMEVVSLQDRSTDTQYQCHGGSLVTGREHMQTHNAMEVVSLQDGSTCRHTMPWG